MFKGTEATTIEVDRHRNDFNILVRTIMFSHQNSIDRIVVNFNKNTITPLMDYVHCHNYDRVFVRALEFEYAEFHSMLRGVCTIIVPHSESSRIAFVNDENLYVESFFSDETSEWGRSENIIWDIPFAESSWDSFDKSLQQLITSQKHTFLFKKILLTKDQILKHPCNVFLCSGVNCHGNHGNIPRYLYVSPDGAIYPYCILCDELVIGNIKEDATDSILQNYLESRSHRLFIDHNRELYLDLIDKCPYNYIPWFEILRNRCYVH